MGIIPDNYIVVIISSGNQAEKKILASLGLNTGRLEDWCYAAYNGSINFLSKPSTADNNFSSSFFLINPECLRSHKACNSKNSKIGNLLSAIQNCGKKIIYWLHVGDNITEGEIHSLALSDSNYFRHSQAVSTAKENGPEHFMFTVTTSNFTERFKALIEYSLEKKAKPHLIALSILCQGYLAVYDIIKPPEGFSISPDKGKMVSAAAWWATAFDLAVGANNFKDTKIGEELISLGKDCETNKGAIEDLFKAVRAADGNEFTDTDKVGKAYECIKELRHD